MIPPAPVASSSGVQRTRQSTREGRRYYPIKTAKKKAESKIDGWDQTLVRFQAEFDTLYSVHYGQPSGGLVPAKALAKINEFMKEDLKRSVSSFFYCVFVHHFTNLSIWQQPLRDSKAGEGKRSRNGEDYLKFLVRAINRTGVPIPASGESNEDDSAAAVLSRRKWFLPTSIGPGELISVQRCSRGRP